MKVFGIGCGVIGEFEWYRKIVYLGLGTMYWTFSRELEITILYMTQLYNAVSIAVAHANIMPTKRHSDAPLSSLGCYLNSSTSVSTQIRLIRGDGGDYGQHERWRRREERSDQRWCSRDR
jgi:hypothetical protein